MTNKNNKNKVLAKPKFVTFYKVKSDKFYNTKELYLGKNIEMEHTNLKRIAKKIAKHHLDEIPDYYTRLIQMEKEAKQFWKSK